MFDETLELILQLEQRKPAVSQPLALDGLFERLAADPPIQDAFSVEDEIWEIWTDHADPAIAQRMNQAIAAIAQKRYTEAETILDALVADQPLWAEAWNKRATLRFLLGRDTESVRDIERTLALEPRHFGAISGFAQICLRNANPTAARLAFEAALRVNPHLMTVRLMVEELKRAYPLTLH